MTEMRNGSDTSSYVEFLYLTLLLLDNKELIVEYLDKIVKASSNYSDIIGNDCFCGVVSTIGNKYG